jgi:uncharacterized protein
VRPAFGSGKMAELAAISERKKRRVNWLRQLYQWHWISSGICLIGMVLFALTGLTLNHAGQIEARPVVVSKDGTLPANLATRLKDRPAVSKEPVPQDVRDWLASTLGVKVGGRDTEWSAREIYVALPRPGGDAWLSIDRNDGAVRYESTDRGWIAYLNDLHKGRHTGTAWSWFIDIFAVACFVFSVTGLLLLQLHAGKRPATWPVVSLGLVIPVLLLVLLVHH